MSLEGQNVVVANSTTLAASGMATAASGGGQNASQQKPVQAIVKRPIVSSCGQVVTKVIITNKPNTNQPQAVPVSIHPNQITILPHGLNATTTPSGSVTPTKTITISQAGMMSPNKGFTTATSTPLPANKIAISPMKTPTKITMIPVSLAKSPQKIVPFSGHNIVVAKTIGSSTNTITTSQSSMVTMSPSKVIYKQQAVGGAKSFTMPIANAGGSNVQQVQVPGRHFHYVRLVTTTQPQGTGVVTSKPAVIAPAPIQAKPIAPSVSVSSTPQQLKITVPVAQSQVQSRPTGTGLTAQAQRILLPATSQIIRPSGTVTQTLSQIRPSLNSGSLGSLPPGTTIIQPNQGLQGVQGFALVPAQYITQLSQPQAPVQRHESANYIPIATLSASDASSTVSSVTGSRHTVNGATVSEPSGQRPRKPCNCTKSQCLKLYCDCFANGEFCHNCNCSNCANNLEHEEERSRAIKSCLDRNPLAFHPKIGKGRAGDGDRRHQKGCNCKRSGCLKNYCECYEAKIMCSSMCKCVGCKNFEESPERKTLMHLADAAEVRVQQQTAAKSKLSSQIQDLPSRPPPPTTGERLPYTFITNEVAEATCSCLLAQAEEGERLLQPEVIQERRILEEFGRCLLQVIESANRTRAPSPMQE